MPAQRCMRFEDREAWLAAKAAAGWPELGAPDDAVVAEIGRVAEPAEPIGEDADGVPIFPAITYAPGWHITVLMLGEATLPAEMAAAEIRPGANVPRFWGSTIPDIPAQTDPT